MQRIPPNLIESSTILSGTQGAAIYGPQGLNGAIILTTKKVVAKEK
jgi:outer membrane receptor protein involved in Fe transport